MQTVFVVEDDEDIRSGIAEILEEHGYAVRAMASARDALRELDAGRIPALIVLDLMMPEMSGWEFRAEQKSRPHAATVPLVAISADRSAQARAIDADAFLPKPFDPEQLMQTVVRVLSEAERQRLQASLAGMERLRSLGRLAAGIAHEINNPLTWVSGSAGLIRQKLHRLEAHVDQEGRTLVHAATELVQYIEDGTDRIASVVRAIRAFASPDPEDRSVLDVNRVLDESLELVSSQFRHRARIIRERGELPSVWGNRAQLSQVFLNLLLNAAGALSGDLSERNWIRLATSRSAEGDALVEISDSGHGIPEDLLGRIFEPFFTTKAIGEGMGLGLTISHQVVSSMGGTISVASKLHEGATFRVQLPAHHPVTA